jgi:hypothetical protein
VAANLRLNLMLKVRNKLLKITMGRNKCSEAKGGVLGVESWAMVKAAINVHSMVQRKGKESQERILQRRLPSGLQTKMLQRRLPRRLYCRTVLEE